MVSISGRERTISLAIAKLDPARQKNLFQTDQLAKYSYHRIRALEYIGRKVIGKKKFKDNNQLDLPKTVSVLQVPCPSAHQGIPQGWSGGHDPCFNLSWYCAKSLI